MDSAAWDPAGSIYRESTTYWPTWRVARLNSSSICYYFLLHQLSQQQHKKVLPQDFLCQDTSLFSSLYRQPSHLHQPHLQGTQVLSRTRNV